MIRRRSTTPPVARTPPSSSPWLLRRDCPSFLRWFRYTFLINVLPYQRTDVFVVPSLVLDVRHACIKQVARSTPTSGRYPPQAAFDNTESFYSIPTQLFTEKFPLADSRTTQGGYTISLFIKKRLRHPRIQSHIHNGWCLPHAQVSTRILVSKLRGGHRQYCYSRWSNIFFTVLVPASSVKRYYIRYVRSGQWIVY